MITLQRCLGHPKVFSWVFVLLAFWFLISPDLSAQQCTWRGTFTTATTGAPQPNNTTQPNCNAFALTWVSAVTVTALSIQIEGSDDGITFTAYSGATTVVDGTNPATTLSGTIKVNVTSKLAFLRVNLTSYTGTGAVSYQVAGYSGTSAGVGGSGGGGGGSCGALAGDVTGTCGANTVVKVNNGSVPASATVIGTNSSSQIIAAALSNAAIWIGSAGNLPVAHTVSGDCTMTNAGVITCTASGNLVSIFGNTGPAITTLVIPSGDSLSFSGTGINNANQLAGNSVTAVTGTGTTVVLSSSPTIVTPTIADFTNANHTHANAAGGGQLDNTAVKTANKVGTGTSFVMANALGGSGNCASWNASGIGDAGAPCGSGSGGGGGVVTYSGPTLSILSGTAFCPIGGGGSCSATETNVDIDSSATATVSNMYVQLSQALGAGNSVAVTWRANASSKTITCTISGAVATACNDTTHSFTATTADLLDYQLVFTGTIIVTPTVTIMSAFGTSNVGVTSVTATAPLTATAGTTPVISATYQGNGPKVQASTGTTTTNDCVKFDANGNTVDSGAACGAGSGVTSVGGLTGAVPGGLILLEQHTASSSAELDFTTCISSSYDEYEINIISMIPGTNAAQPSLQFSSNGGSSYDATAIYDTSNGVYVIGSGVGLSANASGNVTMANIFLGLLSTATPGMSARFRMYDPLSTTNIKIFEGSGIAVFSGDSKRYGFIFGADYRNTAAVNAFRILMSAGNIATAVVRCYGVAKQ